MDNYLPCNSCGLIIDDGNIKDGAYSCHDCLIAEYGRKFSF